MDKNSYEMKTLLIVDDVEINRDILAEIFREQYKILEAENGEVAIEQIENHKDEIVLVLLDLQMPKKNGLDVLKFMNENDLIQKIPVIMITGEGTTDSDIRSYELGASDIIHKPFEPAIVIRRAINVIELYEYKNYLETKLEKRTLQLKESQKKLQKNNDFLINALSSVVEFRSLESGEHIKRVKTFTGILLYHLQKLYPEYGLKEEQMKQIINASALHDIGKIAIPDDILTKPARLTKEEFEIMKTHTTKGCEILNSIDNAWDDEYGKVSYEICRYHHERYDGRGYPDGLKEDAIPISAQIVSIADVYDALVNERVYKNAFTKEKAFRMINEGECGVFSPKILDCFGNTREEFEGLAETRRAE